jgi:outer membrane protein, heavy metal efflux system
MIEALALSTAKTMNAVRSRRFVSLVCIVASVSLQARAEVFRPTAETTLSNLAKLSKTRSVAVRSDTLAAETAKTDIKQAGLLPNPMVDATWGTLPIGDTNPAGLAQPWLNVPNYSIGVSYPFLIGKRAPQIRKAEALFEVARLSAKDTLRRTTLLVARAVAGIGLAQLRVDGLKEEVDDQKEALELARSRLRAGFGTPLDTDRLEIELERIQQQVAAAEGDTEAALMVCASILRMPCAQFESSENARAFMKHWVDAALAAGGAKAGGTPVIADRPDLQVLASLTRAGLADKDAASARSIPDPTVRIGYTRDQFIVSGAQQNALSLSVSLPIPILDHGQAAADSAEVRTRGYGEQRALLLAHAPERIASLVQTVKNRVKRREALETVTLPGAEKVIASLAKSAAERLIPLTDVIQARRTYAELLLQEADSYGDAFDASLSLIEEVVTNVEVP